MVLGPGGRDHDPPNHYYSSLETPALQTIQGKSQITFRKYYFGDLCDLVILKMLVMCVPHIPKLVIRNLKCWNFETLKLWSFVNSKPGFWNFKRLKTRNFETCLFSSKGIPPPLNILTPPSAPPAQNSSFRNSNGTCTLCSHGKPGPVAWTC